MKLVHVGVGFIRPVQGLETFPTKNDLWETSPDVDISGLMNQAPTIAEQALQLQRKFLYIQVKELQRLR